MTNKLSTLLLVLTMASSLSFGQNAKASEKYLPSQFNDVWDQVASDEYELPENEISFSSLFSWGKSLIKEAADRTLNSRVDVLDQFNKLAHPNGVCLRGEWLIDKPNRYSGYFKEGSQALIIARASTAMSATKKGDFRAFGLAGKLFPTINPDHERKYLTANFFVVDDLGGTKADHYTDVAMTNEPPASKTSTVLKNILYALKLATTFGDADENPGIRQVYEIAELGEKNIFKAVVPKWMKIQAAPGQTVDEDDFRDELNVDQYNGQLQFQILVASVQNDEGVKNWKQIGKIIFKKSVVSNSCDHRLHFHHPKWKSNLNH
jgi:hypothetical protein